MGWLHAFILSDLSNLALISGTATETNRVHTVVKCDTLWDIVVKHLDSGAQYTEIVKLNGLTSNVIYSRQKLKISNNNCYGPSEN